MAYGVEPTRLFSAPGRLNLMGSHVEPSEGLVLNCAIDRETVIALGPVGEGEPPMLDVIAIDMGGARDRFVLNQEIEPGDNHWQNLVRGSAETFRRSGHRIKPVRLAIAGDIPLGVGLASSASLGLVLAFAISDYSGLSLSADQLAGIAHAAESEFAGRACEWSDLITLAYAEVGKALLIDCQSREHMPIPVAAGVAVAAIETGVSSERERETIKARKFECERAAAHYHAKVLRELTFEHLKEWRGDLSASAYARAKHVVGEIARVEPMAVALVKSDAKALAQVMRASHVSLRDDFETSEPQIDRLVDIVAAALGDRGGVKLAGHGLGGSVVTVLNEEAIPILIEAVDERYNQPGQVPARVEVYRPANGVARLA